MAFSFVIVDYTLHVHRYIGLHTLISYALLVILTYIIQLYTHACAGGNDASRGCSPEGPP